MTAFVYSNVNIALAYIGEPLFVLLNKARTGKYGNTEGRLKYSIGYLLLFIFIWCIITCALGKNNL